MQLVQAAGKQPCAARSAPERGSILWKWRFAETGRSVVQGRGPGLP